VTVGKYPKTTEFIQQLKKSIPAYIRIVGMFQYEHREFKVVKMYYSKKPLTCQVCGHRPINDVYVIQDTEGRRLIVGNVCIVNVSNHKIDAWFQSFKAKLANIRKHRLLIELVHGLLAAYNPHTRRTLAGVYISPIGIQRLTKMLDRMGAGFTPQDRTKRLASYYIFKVYGQAQNALATTRRPDHHVPK
jgi:hypothetical protein